MGSNSKNSNNGVGGGNGEGFHQIPPAFKKVVESLKEVVKNKNCTEAEIYAVLRDCNMDPNEAAQRLLAQGPSLTESFRHCADTFHEVKSKRERRKEMKETQESKGRGNGNGYRGVKVGGETNIGRVPSQNGYNDIAKAPYKRENGSAPSVSLTYRVKTTNEQSLPHSDSLNTDSKGQTEGTGDFDSSSSHLSVGPQLPRFGGATGNVSMADIVKMGRQQSKCAQMSVDASYLTQNEDPRNTSYSCSKHPNDSSWLQAEMHLDLRKQHEFEFTSKQHDLKHEWPVIEWPTAANGSSVIDESTVSGKDLFPSQPSFYGDGTKCPGILQSEEVQALEMGFGSKNLGSNHIHQKNVDIGVGAPHCSDDSSNNMTSYDPYKCISDHQEELGNGSHSSFTNGSAPLVDEVLSATMNLQQLHLGKGFDTPQDTNQTVVFPDYVQNLSADCSHLSFGTYKSSKQPAVSGPPASNPSRNNLEEGTALLDVSAAVHPDSRNSGNPVENSHDTWSGFMSGTDQFAADVRNHDIPVSAQPDSTRQSIPEVTRASEYISRLSVHDSFQKIQELNSPWSVVISPHATNLSPFHKELQVSSTALPINDLLASSVRGSDNVQSSFHGTQSMPSRYSSFVVPTSSATISVPEIYNSSAFSLPKAQSSALPGTSLPKGHVLANSLSANTYSQSSLPVEELLRYPGYHSVPQSYAHNPSTLQRVHQDSSVLHNAPTGLKYNLPQFKGTISGSSMPLSGTNSLGGFWHDVSTTSNGFTVGYDNVLHSQYRDGNKFTMVQENDNSSTWAYGHGSRAVSAVPDNRYYGLVGQSQQLSRHQRGSQLYQNYGVPDYTNVYLSQAGITHEQPRSDSKSVNSLGHSTKQLHQLWQ